MALVDTTGAVQERFTYSAYGMATALNAGFTAYTGTNYNWTTLFAGRDFDTATGLYYNRARFYNPALGTFINLDPLKSGSNFYAYCGDAPTDATDPMGLNGKVTGGSGAFDHRGVEIDVRDASGNIIGVLSADFAAKGFMQNGPQDESKDKCKALIAAPGHVVLGFAKGGKLTGGLTGDRDTDEAALDRILWSVGKDRQWLYQEVAAGKMSWDLPTRGYYSGIFNNCQTYAHWVYEVYEPWWVRLAEDGD